MDAFFGPVNFQESYLAVDIFFVLSGVVIANAYEKRLQSTLSIKHFIGLRLVRLYPLYILGCSVSVLATLLGAGNGKNTGHLGTLIPLSLLLIPNVARIGDGNPYPLNNPAWSLFFELVANVFYARFLSVLKAPRLALIMFASAACLAVSLYFKQSHNLDMGWTIKSLFAGTFRVGYSFFAGVLLYRLFSSRASTEIKGRFAAYALSGVLALVLALLTSSPGPAIQPYFDFVAVVVIFPAIVYLMLRVELAGGSARLCKFMGATSYALYILHGPLCGLIRGLLKGRAGVSVEDYAPMIGVGLLITLLALCWVIDSVYDGPVRRFLQRRFFP
jgi:peptidoglycan/LPS O-acetylase OafA/YrhL